MRLTRPYNGYGITGNTTILKRTSYNRLYL